MFEGHNVTMICGSRKPNFELRELVQGYFDLMFDRGPILFEKMLWVHGGAEGIDTEAQDCIESIIEDYGGLGSKIFEPEYDKYDRAAPHVRNDAMLDIADHVVIFWDGKSPGTKSVIDKCNKRGIPYDLYKR